jgi:hypothetical protein
VNLAEKRYTDTLKEVLDRMSKLTKFASQEEALKEAEACRALMFDTINKANAVPTESNQSHSISVPKAYFDLIDKLDSIVVQLGGSSCKGVRRD